jgi:hypothetical protein
MVREPINSLLPDGGHTGCRQAKLAVFTVAALLLGMFPMTARAQQATPTNDLTPEQLSVDEHNPFADFFKLPIESDTGFNVGPHHNAGESFSAEPLIPFRLNRDWDLFIRPDLAVTYQPSPHEQFGLNDTQVSLFLGPHNASEWIWGIGPIFELPTATSDALGSGRWSAGPTAALVYSKDPWFNYILTYQLMSFAGDRDRGSIDETYLEPQVSYNTESGWYLDCDPSITFDWTENEANGWAVPMGADLGKSFDSGKQPMSLEIGAYDFLKRPDGYPQWFIRLQITWLFPTGI